MKCVIGLGNPGREYEFTRHNIGFLLVDWLFEQWKSDPWQVKFDGLLSSTHLNGEKVLLFKPQTFMNLSGKAVGPLSKFFKLQPSDLIVAHDDLDLPPYSLRLKNGGGNGGHNGLKSIDQYLGTNAYQRIRLGIGRPTRGEVSNYVLSAFPKGDESQLESLFADAETATEWMIRGEILKAMNRFNQKTSREGEG